MVLSDKRQHLSEKDMRALTAFSVFDSRRGWGWWTGHPCGLLWVRTPPWGLLRRSAEGEAKGEGWLQTEKESDDDRWKMKERLQVKKQKRAKTAMTGVGGGSGDAYYTYNVDWREPSGSPVICWEATLNDSPLPYNCIGEYWAQNLSTEQRSTWLPAEQLLWTIYQPADRLC